MNPSKSEDEVGETSKLLEVPKTEQYDPSESKDTGKERVMAFSDLPSIEIPKDDILTEENQRVIEIYILTCHTSGMSYVGQAVSHILNHGKYRRHGSDGRFRKHVCECVNPSKQKKQSQYLNNAIRKYGADSFTVKVLKACHPKDGDMYEDMGIKYYNTMFPTGYNLKSGGQHFQHTDESRKRVSNGVINYFEPKRVEKFKNVFLSKDIDPEKFLHKTTRNKKQYGWYIMCRDKDSNYLKTDFGGVKETLETSKERAIQFVKYLQSKVNDVKICSDATLELVLED